MSNAEGKSLQYLMIIAEQKKKKTFLSLIGEHGGHSIDVVYARGSVNPNTFASVFGFEVEQGKVIITCLLKYEDAEKLINVLYEEYNFKKPNTGIAFCISVEGLAF